MDVMMMNEEHNLREMDIKEEFRSLVTNKYMHHGFNYENWYSFQTVFYESSYSYF